VKIGARIVSHSRMTIFQTAEVAVPERLFRSMLSRIHRLHEGTDLELVNAAEAIR
jgi:hypothetical protein